MLTLTTPPPATALAGNPIWIRLTTDQINPQYAQFTLTCSTSGPTVGQTLRLRGGGIDITYTVSSTTPAVTGLELPTQNSGESAAAYATRLAAFFRLRADLMKVFRAEAVGAEVRLIMRQPIVADLTITGPLAGITLSATDVTTPAAPDGLFASVQVYHDTGAPATDPLLAQYSAPYSINEEATDLDISDAFAALQPFLPPAATINPTNPLALSYGEATTMWRRYYLRASDTYGAGAANQAHHIVGTAYDVLYGKKPAADLSISGLLRHLTGIKPIDRQQPDWCYWHNSDPTSTTGIYISVLVRWSDGTTSVHTPFGTGTVSVQRGLYWLPSGPVQMRLHTLTPPVGTDPNANIAGYDWRIGPPDETGTFFLGVRRYQFVDDSASPLYLLIDNGLGGMETIWLRGHHSSAIQPAEVSTFTRAPRPDDTAADGDLTAISSARPRRQWQVSTGWHDAQFVHHLRTAALAAPRAWLVDSAARRYTPVIIDKMDAPITSSINNLLSVDMTLDAATYE